MRMDDHGQTGDSKANARKVRLFDAYGSQISSASETAHGEAAYGPGMGGSEMGRKQNPGRSEKETDESELCTENKGGLINDRAGSARSNRTA